MPKAKTPKEKANTSKTLKVQSDPVSQILPFLFLGPSSATSVKSTFIPTQGITHVISVGKRPNTTLDGVSYLRLTIDDDPTADLLKAAREALAFIDAARARRASAKVFVHCSAGISRSPAVVAFYLMHRGMSLRCALGCVLWARPNACPNAGFVRQLKEVEVEMRGECTLPEDLEALPTRKEERLALFVEEDEGEETAHVSFPVVEPADPSSRSRRRRATRKIQINCSTVKRPSMRRCVFPTS